MLQYYKSQFTNQETEVSNGQPLASDHWLIMAAPQSWQHQSKTLLGQRHGIQISQENCFPDNCDKSIKCQSYLEEKSPLFPTISEYDICYEDSIKTFLTIFNCTVPVALSIFTLFFNSHHHPSPKFFTFLNWNSVVVLEYTWSTIIIFDVYLAYYTYKCLIQRRFFYCNLIVLLLAKISF